MISLIITFFIFATYLVYEDKNLFTKYIQYALSLSLAYAVLGLVGLLLLYFNLTFLPLYLLLFVLLVALNLREKFRLRFLNLINGLCEEVKLTLFFNIKKSNISKILLFLLFLLFVLSIGPINYSDTADVYVGYPYKFLILNSHFVDGNLNQGLMGIGDFANIFFIQEKTIWLIRTSQFLPLILIFMFLKRRGTGNLNIFILLTSPVLIQWLTVGKNNFLSESCIAISFLVWEENKNKKYLSSIFAIIMIAIAFKISAVLVSLPILIYIFYFYKSQDQFDWKKIHELISIPLIISVIALISILFYRFFLTGNPLFPFMASIFNPGDKQMLDWEITLKNWERTGFFPIWIFIPKSLGKVSSVLGPATLLIFLIILSSILRNFNFKKNMQKVFSVQVLLLLTFSQARADYYACPLVLACAGFSSNSFSSFNFSKYKLINYGNQILRFFTFSQALLFFISSSYSIFLLGYVIFDYEKGMNKTAYNFYNSSKILKSSSMPVFNDVMGMTHLFFNESFITKDKFNKCFVYEKSTPIDSKYEHCMKKLGVKTIIVKKNKLLRNKSFLCKRDFLLRISRNIFLEKKIEVDFCELQTSL